jgi:L-threonylcarbamoyladenylate synthase
MAGATVSDRIWHPDEAAIERAAACLRAGGLVGMPTETVYGLAADAKNLDAVRSLYATKQRPAENPLIVHVAHSQGAWEFVKEWTRECDMLAEKFWPGPLTLVLRKSSMVSDLVTAGHPTVGVRAPAHDVARALIEVSGRALVAPSANKSGQLSPTTAMHVTSEFPDDDFPVLDGGACALGIESTVLDLTGEIPLILRPGAVTLRALRNILPQVEAPVIGEQRASPGTALRHYAPSTPAVLVHTEELDEQILELETRAAVLSIGPREVSPPHNVIEMPEEATDYAKRFYAGLREADESGARVILIEIPPLTNGVWRAINDRLRRACGERF